MNTRSCLEQSISAFFSGLLAGSGLGLVFAPQSWQMWAIAGAGTTTGTVLLQQQSRRQQQSLDGRQVVTSSALNQRLQHQQRQLPRHPTNPSPRLQLGDVTLTSDHETTHFFIVGKTGAGKSQAIAQLLQTLRQRSDFRVVILDRAGEMLRHFYRPSDNLFNPGDRRSIGWCHRTEMAHLAANEMAASFLPIPEGNDNRIWYEYAQLLLAAIWQTTANNHEVNQALNASLPDLEYLVQGTRAIRCFDEPRLAANVLFTLTPTTKAYDYLHDRNTQFSFFEYGRSDQPQWLFFPLLEGQTETLKPLVSAAIDLIIRGILSRPPYPQMKTAIVIDELGALQRLPSLERLLAEGRKFGGTTLLGTQSEAQISRLYSPESMRILLQNTRTKLILNCPDPETSDLMARVIGKQRFWEEKIGENRDLQSGNETRTKNWDLREQYVIQPSQIQMLPALRGYLLVGDDHPVTEIRLPVQTSTGQTPAFLPHT